MSMSPMENPPMQSIENNSTINIPESLGRALCDIISGKWGAKEEYEEGRKILERIVG